MIVEYKPVFANVLTSWVPAFKGEDMRKLIGPGSCNCCLSSLSLNKLFRIIFTDFKTVILSLRIRYISDRDLSMLDLVSSYDQ